MFDDPLPLDAADVSAPAANTAAVVTYAAVASGQPSRHRFSGMLWSYSGGDPTGGRLTVTDGGAVVLDVDVTAKGPGLIQFPRDKVGRPNQALVVTLAAGGSGVSGKLTVLDHRVG